MPETTIPAADRAHVKEFHKLAWSHLEESFERFPESASKLGLENFNGRLGANDAATHKLQIRLLEQTLARIESQPEAAFTGADGIDRRGFLAMLRTELLDARDLQRWRNNPQVHCDVAVDSIFDLVVRHAGNLERVMPAIESRLGLIPDYLAAGADCVSKPVPLWAKLAAQSCEGAISFLHQIEGELLPHAAKPERLRSLIDGAIRAFEDYAEAVLRKKPGDARGYSIGRANFEFLMRERLGFDCSLPEAKANGHRLVAQMDHLLRQEAAKHGKKNALEILEEAAAHWTPERPLIEEYQRTTAAIKASLGQLGIATLPKGETLKVMPAPAFLQHHFPTAAYNAPPPFSKKQQGIFWVNDLSLLKSDPAEKLAEIRQHFGLELTSAHEAYPGHHLQFAIQNKHPSRLRRLFAHAIFYEGWTMWCEVMSVQKGIASSPYARLQQLHDALWRAHRIVIDCGLHDGSLSPDGAARVLMQGVQFTKARAMGDVNWYTSSPTVPMSYLLGRIEVEKLHKRFVLGEGWSLQQFNDWMLSHGAVPWRWILKAHDEGLG